MSLVTNLLGHPHKMWGPIFTGAGCAHAFHRQTGNCTSALRYPNSVILGSLVFAWHSNRHILTLAQFRGSRCTCQPGKQLIVLRLPRRVAQRQDRCSAHCPVRYISNPRLWQCRSIIMFEVSLFSERLNAQGASNARV